MGKRKLHKFCLCYINKDYLDTLNCIHERVPEKFHRPFIVGISEINGFMYAIPMTTKTRRHNGQRRNPRYTIEMKAGTKDLGAILFNNMIPVTPEVVIPLDLWRLPQSYQAVFNQEIQFIRKNRDLIEEKAQKTYDTAISLKDPFFTEMCCNFKLLEKYCRKYCHLPEPPQHKSLNTQIDNASQIAR